MNSPDNITADSGAMTGLAYIALGSNRASPCGTPVETIRAAVARIGQWSTQEPACSSLWISEPQDCPPGSPPFINAVIGLAPEPAETAHSLLQRMQDLEREFGRQRGDLVNAPRSLDLDLICFAELRLEDPALVLPHPAAHSRLFVLLPLSEIAPQLRLPGQRKSVSELARELVLEGPFIAKIDD